MQYQATLPIGFIISDPYWNKYNVEALLGTGGFGAVYLVREQGINGTLFALKEAIVPSKQERDRYVFEGEVLKKLEHRALPRVHQFFEDDCDRTYLLMDYIRGANLEQLRLEQPEGRIPLPKVLSIMAPVVDAVSYLHKQSPPVIHRDIKPENIIVPTASDEAVLVDFGLAKEYFPEGTTTIIRHGTPGYAAPEQYGGGTNPRTDVYGLGGTLYTLLTGIIPADAIQRWTADTGVDPLVPANQITPAIPVSVAKDITRAMSLNSKERFASVEEFWRTLQFHAAKHYISASTPGIVDDNQATAIRLTARSAVSRSKRPVVLLTILFALLLIIGSGAAAWLFARVIHNSSPVQNVSFTSIPGSTTPLTPTVRTVPYPLLTEQYMGTIGDIVAKTTTNMTLSSVRQSGKDISGYFNGLGLNGTFKGTVDAYGHIQFQVAIYSGRSTLSFEGAIQIGGIISGSYRVLNQNNQFTGESGLWSVTPQAHGQS